MKHIITITESAFALSAITFAAATAVLRSKVRRKPTMNFLELLRDNNAADFLFISK